MPRTKKQFEEMRENKKDIILHAALHLFAEEGYHNTPISKIAKSAGMSKGLMYNYFESKEELLRALIYMIAEKIGGNLFSIDKNIVDKAYFAQIINELFDIIEKDIVHWRLYINLISQPGIVKLFENEIEMMHKNAFKIMTHFFDQMKLKHPYAQAILLHALMDGVVMNYMNDPENFPLQEVKELIIEKFFGQLT